MTKEQQRRIVEFETEARRRGKEPLIAWKESRDFNSIGFLFGIFEEITLTLSPKGLIGIPSVRTYHPPKYPTPVIAAVSAQELWMDQKRRDDADREKAKSRRTGHLDPIVDTELKCRDIDCHCHRELPKDRQKRAQGGFNTDPDRCS